MKALINGGKLKTVDLKDEQKNKEKTKEKMQIWMNTEIEL